MKALKSFGISFLIWSRKTFMISVWLRLRSPSRSFSETKEMPLFVSPPPKPPTLTK